MDLQTFNELYDEFRDAERSGSKYRMHQAGQRLESAGCWQDDDGYWHMPQVAQSVDDDMRAADELSNYGQDDPAES